MARKPQVWLPVTLVVVVGVYLRFHMLGVRSLWPAECFSVLVARQPWPRFLRTLWWGEGNMAFYYFLLRGWLHLGDSDVWLQSLSALFGVMAIPAIFALGDRSLSWKAGLIGAALLTIHNFHIEHSEEVRSYSLLVLLVVLSTHSLLRAFDSPDKRTSWLCYVVFSTLALYTQFFVIFILCAQWLALTPAGVKRLGFAKLLATIGAIALLSTPISAVMLLRNQGQLDWIPKLSIAGGLEVFRSIVGAEHLAVENWFSDVFLSIAYIFAWSFVAWQWWSTRHTEARDSIARTTISVLAWCLLFPVLAMAGLSLFKPILYPRYVLMCVPAAVLLAAQGLLTIERQLPHGRMIASACFLIIVAGAFTGTQNYHKGLAASGDDWRAATKYIVAHAEQQDAVMFCIADGDWAFDFYAGREHELARTVAMPAALYPLSYDAAVVEKRTEPYRRVWLVLHQDIPTVETDKTIELLRGALQRHFHFIGETQFRGSSPQAHGENNTILVDLYDSALRRESH